MNSWKIEGTAPRCFIFRTMSGEYIRNEYLCPDGKIRGNYDYTKDEPMVYYYESQEAAQLKLNAWYDRLTLETRLVKAEGLVKEIKKELALESLPELKHGDVTTNFNDYYFLWLRGVEGQLRMANKLHIMPATWSKKYEEGDRERIVGNIFDGYNPWKDKKEN